MFDTLRLLNQNIGNVQNYSLLSQDSLIASSAMKTQDLLEHGDTVLLFTGCDFAADTQGLSSFSLRRAQLNYLYDGNLSTFFSNKDGKKYKIKPEKQGRQGRMEK